MQKEKFSNLFLEDMIANAFIELNKKDENIRKISLELAENFGDVVRENLLNKYQYVNLCLSREATEKVRVTYKRYFTFEEDYSTIILNEGITIHELIIRFRTYLPFDQLLAYMDDEVVKKGLLEPMNLIKQEENVQKKIGIR